MGDPHFNTWSNEWYDFHGESCDLLQELDQPLAKSSGPFSCKLLYTGICDLVLLSAQEFAQGLGLDIHSEFCHLCFLGGPPAIVRVT